MTLAGRLPGLEAIEAINPSRPICRISEFDPKKRIMTLFLPNRKIEMEPMVYGLAHGEDGTYEKFQVVQERNNVSVLVKEALKDPFKVNAPICRILYGDHDNDGNYVFRVRDDGGNMKYLVRYRVSGEDRFQMIDFAALDGVELT